MTAKATAKNLQQDIAAWDGKSVDVITDVYRRYSTEDRFLADLVGFLKNESVQRGASWLLKHALEDGKQLDGRMTGSLFGHLSGLTYWETRLHVLQCLSCLKISQARLPQVESFLRRCLEDNNKFVRAWAYNGFDVLARQYPQYREEADSFFAMAMRDEAASVKARIRQIQKASLR